MKGKAIAPAALEAAIRQGHAAGKTRVQIAQEFGYPRSTVYVAAKAIGLKFIHASTRHNDPRADQMAAMFKAGYTLEKIGQHYGITRERVRQLIKKYHGIVGKDGGKSAIANVAREKRSRARDLRYFAKYGCSYKQVAKMREIGRQLIATGMSRERTPIGAFILQRNNAHRRGIAWNLKFWQWWTIWQESGHWEQRGRGQGYVMARLNDDGPYDAGNVFICTAAENSSDQKRKKSGLPMGVIRKTYPYYTRYVAKRSINGRVKYLGEFPTPELAHVAYLSAGEAA